MRKVIQIAWNDIRMELSDRSALIFLLILPVIFTLIIGASLRPPSRGEDPRFPYLVVDEDLSPLSKQFKQYLEESDITRPVYRPAAEAASIFEDKQIPAILTIPAGFETSLIDNNPVQLSLRKHAGDNSTFSIEQNVRAAAERTGSLVAIALISTSQAQSRGAFSDVAEQQVYFEGSLSMASGLMESFPVNSQTTYSQLAEAQIAEGFNQSSPGQLVTWSLITLIAAAEVFVSERLGGTLRRLVVTPTPKGAIVGGKLLGRLLLGLLQITILITFGAVFLGVNWARSPASLIAVVLSFALAAVSFGVLLGTFAKTRGQASWLTIMFSMLLAALGGAWWPLEVTPPAYQTAVQVLPTTWAMKGFSHVLLRGYRLGELLPEIGMLLLFAAVFFSLAVWRLKFE